MVPYQTFNSRAVNCNPCTVQEPNFRNMWSMSSQAWHTCARLWLFHTILYYTILYYTILYYAILCYTMLCYAMLCYALYYTLLCYAICYALFTWSVKCGKAQDFTNKTTTTTKNKTGQPMAIPAKVDLHCWIFIRYLDNIRWEKWSACKHLFCPTCKFAAWLNKMSSQVTCMIRTFLSHTLLQCGPNC